MRRLSCTEEKLTRKTWIYNELEANGWSHDALTLVPWGRLYFWSDGSAEPTGGGWSGPTQDFEDFLANGPAEPNTPVAIVKEVRAMLLAAGVTSARTPKRT
jgi:hypothetical protein